MTRRLACATRKHVTLSKFDLNGKTAYELLGPDGRSIEAFSIFNNVLMAEPFNTRRRYCLSLADFYDYFFEAGTYLQSLRNSEGLAKSQLLEIIETWRDYQVYGADSGSELVRAINLSLPSPRVGQSTADNKHAALGRFLKLSEKIRQDSLSLSKVNIMRTDIDVTPLLSDFGKHVRITGNVRSVMIKNSMLASVIAGGPQTKSAPIFHNLEISKFDKRRTFPLDSLDRFINELPSYRDKAIYELYAASGCRASEGLQLLWEDVNIAAGTVRLVDPATRPNHPSYLALTHSQRQKLSWKGRHTEMTLLIEPFVSKFFEFLEIYHREEYYPHGRHGFVFQSLKTGYEGQPYFATDYKTRQEVFKKAAKAIDLPVQVDGPHSLRHAYGTYLLNYLPISENEYGMPIGLVRLAMGHETIKSTSVYAMADEDLLQLKLQLANSNVFDMGGAKSVRELKLGAIRAQMKELQEVERKIMLGLA